MKSSVILTLFITVFVLLSVEASPEHTKPDQPADRRNITTVTIDSNTKELFRHTTAVLKQVTRATQTIWILLKTHVSNAITILVVFSHC